MGNRYMDFLAGVIIGALFVQIFLPKIRAWYAARKAQ